MKKIKHVTLAETTYRSLKKTILTGQYAPGQRLQIEAVAEKLGVSPTPLREAFVRLANEGLVEIVARKGTYVRMLDQEAVRQSYEIREVLEGLAARKAAECASTDDVEELRKINADFKKAVDQRNVGRILSADLRFHDKICAVSRNAKLKQIVNDYVFTNLLNNTGSGELFLQNGESASRGHDGIIDAIEKHDGDRAERLIREQIRIGMSMAIAPTFPREER